MDTVHILAGVPSTQTLLDIAQVPLSEPHPSTSSNPLQRRTFSSVDGLENAPTASHNLPDENGLDRVAKEARACGEVNYVGTVLALACFVSGLIRFLCQSHGADGSATYAGFYLQVTGAASPLVSSCDHSGTLSCDLLSHQSSGVYGCRKLSSRM